MLVDTNVWSELTRPRPDPKVSRWMSENFDACILSAIVLAEIQYGIAKAEDDRRRHDLETFRDDLLIRIGERTAPFDAGAAAALGSLKARLGRSGKLIADMDMLIAAHAIALDVPLVTRNVGDMERTEVVIVNPWAA